jgi:hypothetical protein
VEELKVESESESEGENNMNNSLAAIMAFSLIYN